MNDCIVCLVGQSGVGKTTVAYKVAKDMGYNVLESFTTRPPRYEGEKGHTFVESCDEPKENMIAYTKIKGFDYWATKNQIMDKGVSFYVIDPIGVVHLKHAISKLEIPIPIFVIFLHGDEMTRKQRLIQQADILFDNYKDFAARIKNRLETIESRMSRDDGMFDVVDCNVSINANRDLDDVAVDVCDAISLFLESLEGSASLSTYISTSRKALKAFKDLDLELGFDLDFGFKDFNTVNKTINTDSLENKDSLEQGFKGFKEKEKSFDLDFDLGFNKKKDVLEYIIYYLNHKAGTKYNSAANNTIKLINARLKEGFTVDDFKKVIDYKVSEWKDNPDMAKYLRPATLFSGKFDWYLSQSMQKKPVMDGVRRIKKTYR